MCSQTRQRTSYNTFHFLKIFSHALGCQMETFKFALTCGWNSLHPISSITSAKRPLRLYTCLCHPRGPKTPLWVGETTDRVRLYCSSLSDMHGLLTMLNCHRGKKGGEPNTAHFLTMQFCKCKRKSVKVEWQLDADLEGQGCERALCVIMDLILFHNQIYGCTWSLKIFDHSQFAFRVSHSCIMCQTFCWLELG